MKNYILYAEDDQDDFVFLKNAIQQINPEINLVNVESGYDLIKFLQDRDADSFPSLIIMDLKMPMLDGQETLDLLKLDDRLKTIPVVLFSGSTNPKDIDLANIVGSQIIKKPSRYEEWLAIAKKLVGYSPVILLAMICK